MKRDIFRQALRNRFLVQLHALVILLTVVASGVVLNAQLYRRGLRSMAGRYSLSLTASYVVLFVLIKLWLALIAGRWKIIDALPGRVVSSPEERIGPVPSDSTVGMALFLETMGEYAILFLIVGFFFFGAYYLIAETPEILIEAAFQVALSTGLIRSLGKSDSGWTGTVFRRTFFAYAVCLCLAWVASWVAHLVCPGATRLIEVFRQCTG